MIGYRMVLQSNQYNWDIEAINIINVLGISSNVEKIGINEFIISLKNAGIWSKINLLYPFYGSTATTHKWNWKDMQDTNSAGRLTFVNDTESAHLSTGYKPNGVDQYANTNIVFNNIITNNNFHGALFTPARGTNGNKVEIGANPIYISQTLSSGLVQYQTNVFGASNAYGNILVSDDYGFLLYSKTGTTSIGYISGHKFGEVTANSTTGSTQNITLGALGASFYSNANLSYVSIGQPLSDSECVIYSSEVDKLLTALGRNKINGIFHGDSITYGTAATDRDTLSYRALLSALYGSLNINYGNYGNTLIQGTTNSWYYKYLNEVRYKTNQRKYMVIMYGINDASIARSDSVTYSYANYLSQFGTIMNHIVNNRNWPPQNIIVCSFPWASNGNDNYQTTFDLIDAISDVAGNYGCQYINLYDYIKNNPNYTCPDNIHPDNNGHDIIADYLYSQINRVWEQ